MNIYTFIDKMLYYIKKSILQLTAPEGCSIRTANMEVPSNVK